MLCCGGKKDSNGRDLKSAQNTPSRQPLNNPNSSNATTSNSMAPPPLHQDNRTSILAGQDFSKKVSGISNEIFRQIETVENRYDQSTAEAFRTVQKSGEMVVRKLDPRQFIRLASETAPKINVNTNDPDGSTSFVEIVKRPGQTLGLYIREGNGMDRTDGVFVSRIALESAVYSSGCIVVGDEILAVNLVDVTRMSLDDVVIIMSIPRRLVLTTRRKKTAPLLPSRPTRSDHKPAPVVVFKGDPDQSDFAFRASDNNGANLGHHNSGTLPPNGSSDRAFGSPAGRRDQAPFRDSRTLTWDRNPKPDRNDPKYFPVNSLPRQGGRVPNTSLSPPRDSGDWRGQESGYGTPNQTPRGEHGYGDQGYGYNDNGYSRDMPPPMHALPSYQPPPPVVTEQPRLSKEPTHFKPYKHPYNTPGLNGKAGGGLGADQSQFNTQSRDHGSANHRADNDFYSHNTYNNDSGYRGGRPSSRQGGSGSGSTYQQSTDAYRKPMFSGTATNSLSRKSYTMSHHNGYRGMRARNFSGDARSALDYASDTEAVQSPPSRSLRNGRLRSAGTGSRSNSLPRTFNREALLRHPELSMEIDRLSDTMSEIGDRLSVSTRLSHRGARSPSSFSTISQDMGKRTPSTSAIYETLRRSKELRESLSRPGSRMSVENIPEKLKEPDLHYFSDSEHHSVMGGGLMPRQELRRLRNRTLSGLDTLRMGEQARERSHSLTIGGGGMQQLNNMNHTPRTPCTPTFANEKDAITNFVDFNPADFIKYKIDRYSEAGDLRLSGSLHVHLLSGRGLKTAGKYKRFRDLYCVVEVDHVHKARTVVRSGGLNFDWDEKFQLDLLNNMEVEFLIYSWDPQLRHRLCYRTSLRLGNLFGHNQRYHQIALRLHPAGVVYLTVRYTQLSEAYNRSTNTLQPGQLFGVSLESVVEQENSGFLVPLLVKRCTQEIEKRGLDIIGLYRLCGSETKKKMLRETFEADPEAVDLSSENVPDINVITSLLKEYLRELPEPVFSSCLYQMLLDALGVFLPNDPDGNAKLVFSILDCLPQANRNCLVHLLDHLAAVTSQASRNKMNPHNLAICFAPVLMLDTSDHLDLDTEPSIVQQLQILKYLIEIWPKSQEGL